MPRRSGIIGAFVLMGCCLGGSLVWGQPCCDSPAPAAAGSIINATVAAPADLAPSYQPTSYSVPDTFGPSVTYSPGFVQAPGDSLAASTPYLADPSVGGLSMSVDSSIPVVSYPVESSVGISWGGFDPALGQVSYMPGPASYSVSGAVAGGETFRPPYSYYEAFPEPAREYVSIGATDVFPFYGQTYGHAYDKWTWTALSGDDGLSRYYYPPVR